MKKLLTVLAGVSILTACNVAKADDSRFDGYGSGSLSIVVDTQTSCKYIVYDQIQKGGITPLLKSDGTPDCEK